MKISLIVCLSSLLLYVFIMVVFALKIKKAKYNAAPRIIEGPGKQFYMVFGLSALAILLPILIPLETRNVIIVCACGVLGEFVTLKNRLEEINKKK